MTLRLSSTSELVDPALLSVQTLREK